MSELAIDAICKNLVVFKVLSKEILELNQRYWVVDFRVTFIPMPVLDNCSAEK